MVAAVFAVTLAPVILNVALFAPKGMVTVAGTVAAELLDLRLITAPVEEAKPLR